MTIVEECSNADVGVGAAIAERSQLLNGNWLLFVNKAMLRKKAKYSEDKPLLNIKNTNKINWRAKKGE